MSNWPVSEWWTKQAPDPNVGWKYEGMLNLPWMDMPGHVFSHRHLRAILSGDIIDGKRWVHLSVVRKDRMPDWAELVAARDGIVGPEVEMIQYLPKKSEWANIHDFVLHLWKCVESELEVVT